MLETIMEVVAGYADMLVLILYFKVMFDKCRQWVSPIYFWSINIITYGVCILCSTLKVWGEAEGIIFLAITFCLSLLYSGSIVWHVVKVLGFQIMAMLAEIFTHGIYTLVLQKEIIYGKDIMLENTMMASSKIFIFIMVLIVAMIYQQKKKEYRISKGYQFSMIMISLLSVGGILLQVQFENGVLENSNFATYVMSFLLLFINLFVYALLNKVIENAENTKEKEKMELLIRLQEEKYDEVSENFRQVRRVIHDTRKHFRYIQNGIEEKEYDDVYEYIKKADFHLTKQYEKVHTGNLAIDAMVTNGIRQAEREGIEFETDIRVDGKRIYVDKYDLCALLGNLIDNAIEGACKTDAKEARYVKLCLFTEEHRMIIETENGIEKGKVIDFRKSSKANKEMHGFGMQNIQEIVNNYGGNMNISQNERRVRIVAYIPYEEDTIGKENED